MTSEFYVMRLGGLARTWDDVYHSREAAVSRARARCGASGGVYGVFEVRQVARVRSAGPHPTEVEEA